MTECCVAVFLQNPGRIVMRFLLRGRRTRAKYSEVKLWARIYGMISEAATSAKQAACGCKYRTSCDRGTLGYPLAAPWVPLELRPSRRRLFPPFGIRTHGPSPRDGIRPITVLQSPRALATGDDHIPSPRSAPRLSTLARGRAFCSAFPSSFDDETALTPSFTPLISSSTKDATRSTHLQAVYASPPVGHALRNTRS